MVEIELEPEVAALLAELHGPHALDSMRREPLYSPESATLAPLECVTIDVGGQEYRYVVKRISRLGEWLARATDDRLIREHQLAKSGVFDNLPPGVSSATLASTATEYGAAIVMLDVTAGLMPPRDEQLSHGRLHTSLTGLAHMHARFAGFDEARGNDLGLNRLESWLTPLSPATARREALQPVRDP